MSENQNKHSAGFLTYLISIIFVIIIFIMAVTTVLSNDYQERGQMKQCEETILSETYYSPVCFFGDNYQYAKVQ